MRAKWPRFGFGLEEGGLALRLRLVVVRAAVRRERLARFQGSSHGGAI